MDVELRQLRAFVAVVDAGTFTGASAALGLSQATVSRSVLALEAALGVRLLERDTRNVALTSSGTRVVGYARRVLDDVAQLRRAVEAAPAELRVGYAWAALGKHTRRVQRRWADAHADVPLIFVQSNTATAGLAEGLADMAVVRRELDDPRFATALIGVEARYAALASDNPLARRRSLRLADLLPYTIAVDTRTGTTTPALWPDNPPRKTRTTHGVDEWLTLIAAGQAVGVTSEATANQNPRPGVAYRSVRDAPPIPVWLAWWQDDPPRQLDALLRSLREAYAGP